MLGLTGVDIVDNGDEASSLGTIARKTTLRRRSHRRIAKIGRYASSVANEKCFRLHPIVRGSSDDR
jgi:hypothetical protein